MLKQLLTTSLLSLFVTTHICTLGTKENNIPINIHLFQLHKNNLIENALTKFAQEGKSRLGSPTEIIYQFKSKSDVDNILSIINTSNDASLICNPFLIPVENKPAKMRLGNSDENEKSYFELEITPTLNQNKTVTCKIICNFKDIQNNTSLNMNTQVRIQSKYCAIEITDSDNTFILFISIEQ